MRVLVITLSDRAARGEYEDRSGPEIVQLLTDQFADADIECVLLGDDADALREQIGRAPRFDVITATGGTGIGPRDVTPEACAGVCERLLPGIGEVMREVGRRSNPRAALSRGLAGVRKRTLIVNLPGSPKGAVESLDAIAELLPHAVEVLHGSGHDSI